MAYKSELPIILEGDKSLLAKTLFERLKPSLWPFKLHDLPEGTVLVGGALRDELLNIHYSMPDLDFVVPSDAIKTCKSFASQFGGTAVELDVKRDISRFVIDDWKIDIASQLGKDLHEDLFRRDFTINAIALQLSPTPILIDPLGGLRDLKNRKLVAISEKNLIDDPLRMIRALRFMSELNLELDPKTQYFLENNATLLKLVASERIKDEIEKLIHGAWADDVLPLLKQIRLLAPWSTNLKEQEIDHLSLKNVSSFKAHELKIALPLVRLSSLLSEQGLVKLGFSRKMIRNCNSLRNWQKRNDGFGFRKLNEVDRLKLHLDLENHLPALIMMLSSFEQKIWLERWRDPLDPLFHPSSPLDGNSLKSILNAPEGPWIGELIYFLCKEKAFGRLHNRAEAIELARNWWLHNKPFCD